MGNVEVVIRSIISRKPVRHPRGGDVVALPVVRAVATADRSPRRDGSSISSAASGSTAAVAGSVTF
ncbi:MAG: hypothetical protein IKJ45_11135, partial [Kiritimatiellae bacterium]|nr:hypothetical protein [Kiritimatiellia bacterium]